MAARTLQDIRRSLVQWEAAWKIDGLADRISLEVGPRLRRSLGRCQPAKGLIRLAPAVLDGPAALLEEILCHEVAHVGVFAVHGRKARPHGAEWRALMEQAGFLARARIPEAVLPETVRRSTQPTVEYRHFCPVCHASRTARRLVSRWRCAACVEAGLEGRLEVVSCPLAERAID